MVVARLQEVWEAALTDAGFDQASARLYVFTGAPPRPNVPEANWYPPGGQLYTTEDDPFGPAQLADANSDAHHNLHRMSVFAGATLIVIEGRMRHELQHAVQWDVAGPHVWDFRRLIDHAMSERVGGIAGSGVLYNILPSESNANAAARRFLLARHGGDAIGRLLESSNAALVREVQTARGTDGLGLQHACFAAIYADEMQTVAEQRDMNVDDVLEPVDPRAPGLWTELAHDQEFQQLRQASFDAQPDQQDVEDVDGEDLFERWVPLRDAVQVALLYAYAVAGL